MHDIDAKLANVVRDGGCDHWPADHGVNEGPLGGSQNSRRVGNRRLLTAGAFAAVVASASASFADATNPAVAEALFQEAKRLVTAGRYEEACPKLEESNRLDPGTGTLLNLAVCYEKSGKTATAWAKFNEAASAARREGRADRVKMATDSANALTPSLSHFAVTVPAAADLPGLEVRVDNTVLGRASWGFPLPYDPGNHEVAATAVAHKPFRIAVILAAKGARQEVVIQPLENEPAQSPAPKASTTSPVVRDSAEPPPASRGPKPPPTFAISAAVGAGYWVAGIPRNPEPSLAVTLAGDARALTLANAVELRLGLKSGVSFISEKGSKESFLTVLANPKVTFALVPERIHLFAEVGVGALVILGLPVGSVILKPTANNVDPALSTFHVRPGLGISFATTRWLSIYASGSFGWSPSPSKAFLETSVAQAETSVGVVLGFD